MEAFVNPLGVIPWFSYQGELKILKKSYNKILVYNYYFYVHQICFLTFLLLQHHFSFH